MPETLITLGSLLLFGLLTFWLGSVTALPRVTLLILMGILIGPSGLDLFQETREFWLEPLATLALIMVGFLLGGTLNRSTQKHHGTQIIIMSIGIALITLLTVTAGLMLFTDLPLEATLLLGAIATATAPAATAAVIDEQKESGEFGTTLLGVVALDDIWGLIIFSLCLTFATGAVIDNGLSIFSFGLQEIVGALLVGVALGLPMSFLTGRIREGEPTLIEALGLVFICGGIALWLEVSYLIAAMAMGATVANFAKHHTRPFHAIKNIQSPFLVLFFILAGASLNLETFMGIGLVGGLYIALRLTGKIAGGWIAGRLSGMSNSNARWMGAAMLPQAGVAVGMALIVGQSLPEHANTILTVTIAATALFEIVGPVATRAAIKRCK
jgi:Kef-type K+ transport system membrane component KefB